MLEGCIGKPWVGLPATLTRPSEEVSCLGFGTQCDFHTVERGHTYQRRPGGFAGGMSSPADPCCTPLYFLWDKSHL